MIRTCLYNGCNTLLLTTAGATVTRHCSEHRDSRNVEESDDERIERVCREMGWRRAKERR
jgi:hypothetical protein